jgi:uncharacterized membrane protein
MHIWSMKKSLILLIFVCFATPALAESTNATGPSDALAGTLMLIGQLLLVIVAVLVALAWIWFPFMVKGRLDKIIRKLDNLEQLQGKLCAAPPIRS